MNWNDQHANRIVAGDGRGLRNELSRPQGDLTDHEESWLPTRREVIVRALGASVAFAGLAVGIPLVPDTAHAAPTRLQGGVQDSWRFCTKCQGLFFDAPDWRNHHCPAGGLHNPLGYNFILSYNVPETPTVQRYWRFCVNCHGLFFHGRDGSYYRQNQRCSVGGLHSPRGSDFVLPHDGGNTYPPAQPGWRFCGNCHGLFFHGPDREPYYRQNQRCAAGGLHNPLGYNFVLSHRPPQPANALSTGEYHVWVAVNDARKGTPQGCSAPRLQVDPRLAAVARAHSQDLAGHPGLWEKIYSGWPGHYGSDGSVPEQRIKAAVGSPGTENVYVRYIQGDFAPPTAQTAFNWWMNESPTHRANLLNCRHRSTGVGIAVAAPDSVGRTYYYFTQVFHS